jgi:hypothetical protein
MEDFKFKEMSNEERSKLENKVLQDIELVCLKEENAALKSRNIALLQIVLCLTIFIFIACGYIILN